jgi:hypothetical protein
LGKLFLSGNITAAIAIITAGKNPKSDNRKMCTGNLKINSVFLLIIELRGFGVL